VVPRTVRLFNTAADYAVTILYDVFIKTPIRYIKINELCFSDVT